MTFLRRLVQFLLGERDRTDPPRVYLQDEELIAVIKEVAREQSRGEEEVVADFTKAGLNEFQSQIALRERWSSLSHREQQVVALVALGYRNYEIAQTLGIAPETVKTHLQHIFGKFQLRGSKELRLVLKDWDFREWWEQNQHD